MSLSNAKSNGYLDTGFVGNHLINNTRGSYVFGDHGSTGLGNVFASNIIEGNVSTFPPGSQGTVSNNWVYGNEWRGATSGVVWGRYSDAPQREISIFDYNDSPLPRLNAAVVDTTQLRGGGAHRWKEAS